MNKKSKLSGFFFALAGLLVLAALALTGYNLMQEQKGGEASQEVLQELKAAVAEKTAETQEETQSSDETDDDIVIEQEYVPIYVRIPEIAMPEVQVESYDYIGVVAAPAIGLELPVISHWSYPAMKVAPCRYCGSVYTDDLIIVGHSYATHFGHLEDFSIGDSVYFTDGDGNVFYYIVSSIEVLDAAAVEEMEEGDWDLTLFTCTWDGLSRLTIRCERTS